MISKVAVVLFGLVVAVAAFDSWGQQYPQTGGHSNTYRKQDDHGNYKFGYEIVDPKGAKNSRHESGDGWGNRQGSYSLKDIDGRERHVEYVADKTGFRAQIKTNEPGTGSVDAGDAIYNGADPHGGSQTYVPSGSSGWNAGH